MNTMRTARCALTASVIVLLTSLAFTGCKPRQTTTAGGSAAGGKNIVTLTEKNFASDVLASTTPVLVDFWAPWCGPCRMIAPTLEELAGEYNGRVRIGKVNVDDETNLAQKYGIQAIPALLMFKDGKVADQVVGVRSKKELKEKLDKLLAAK